ncbi:MAG TPA: acetate--CoA ligase [Burkholderiaceae bacterium]|nr:acetate--CoA ligase [Burkholderiaceae bacterium]
MRPTLIRKDVSALRVRPHLYDWPQDCRQFQWDEVRRELAGLPGGGLNIAYEAVERHALSAIAQRTAVHWLGQDGTERRLTFADLEQASSRFANVLGALGIGRGDVVFLLLPRIPDIHVCALGALKAGAVVAPLFSAFGPEPIATRINIGRGKALVTTEALYRRKVLPVREGLPTLQHVLLARPDSTAPAAPLPGTRDLESLMTEASAEFTVAPTRPDDLALLHFTSGTTGRPKGALHVHEAVVTHWATGRFALDLHDDDVFWCTADPGWVTGMSYGVIAPLLHGVTMIVDEAEFDAERWYRILQAREVSVWYTAPTAIRMLMKAGPELARRYRFPRLRFVASVGEPLNPEAVWWGQEVLGLPIHDNWWQTETGGIMIANTPALDIKPGSMGKPLPGVEAFIVRRRDDGPPEVVDEPDVEGELALRKGWPSMFRGYLGDDERYRKCFAGDLYLTGDLARRDADGYYWFVGRADDVIKSAGHLIGPFEVESALMEHPAVAEAGVIGKPDPIIGETVKAFVALKSGQVWSDALRLELLGHARKRLGPAVAPKEIDCVATLPRTRSGKIMRRLLKARELGLPEGDTSTLESGS